jgi:hypothetical protein
MDFQKRLGPDGNIPEVVELLAQTNEILTDAVHKEGNLPTGDRVTIRTGLPNVYYRALNAGIPSSKSTTAQVDEGCALLEARSNIDIEVAQLNGNTASFRLGEDIPFLEAMNQEQASCMFYGNPATDPKKYLGLATRYGLLSAGNGNNIISAGGSDAAHNTSIYLVGWGDQTVYCPFPKGSTVGLTQRDLGELDVSDGAGGTYRAYCTQFIWKSGLVVKDWRYVVRIPNIYTTDLLATTGTQATTAATNIINLMARALYKVPSMARARFAFYMNGTVHAGLTTLALAKTVNVLTIQEGLSQFGTPHSWMSFLGVPLRRVDAILNTEAVVV